MFFSSNISIELLFYCIFNQNGNGSNYFGRNGVLVLNSGSEPAIFRKSFRLRFRGKFREFSELFPGIFGTISGELKKNGLATQPWGVNKSKW